jgi:hypothetical protein
MLRGQRRLEARRGGFETPAHQPSLRLGALKQLVAAGWFWPIPSIRKVSFDATQIRRLLAATGINEPIGADRGFSDSPSQSVTRPEGPTLCSRGFEQQAKDADRLEPKRYVVPSRWRSTGCGPSWHG